MVNLVTPHGGNSLKALLLAESDRVAASKRAYNLIKVPMSSRETSDVLMLAMGAYTPLEGFMCEADWHGTCAEMKLQNGLFWPIPITLSVDRSLANQIKIDEDVALFDEETGKTMAIMNVSEKFEIDKDFENRNIFGTTDTNHPGVKKVLEQPDVNLGGAVKVFDEGDMPNDYKDLYLRPAETRALFNKLGWSKVTAFQTRNPMHRSHEHLVKIAIEITDGVFIHQVLGKLKEGDIPAETRTEAIAAMIDNYFVPGTALQGGYPIEMRYAGPREALFHALIRQNFGCAYLIVGRDHAGVGDYYGPYDAQDIFDELWEGALETQPLKIDITFYCKKCQGMATEKTSPSKPEDRVHISGTKFREMLENGEDIPVEFSRPEVVEVLRKYYSTSK